MTLDCLKDRFLLKFRLNLHTKSQGIPSGDDLDNTIAITKNEPIYHHPISAARVEAFLPRNNGDIYGSTISYCQEVGGRKIIVDRHLNQLFPFIDVEKQLPQETIDGLAEDSIAEDLAPEQSTKHHSAQDEFHTDPASPKQ